MSSEMSDATSYDRIKTEGNESSPPPGCTPMKRNLLALICIAVLCITLSLGLWPFHAPKNDVSWLENQHGLLLGKNATLFSSRSLQTTISEDSPEASVEIWLLPRRIWDSGTFLSFYHPENQSLFSLRQSLTDLLVQTETQSESATPKARFYVDDLFRPRRPVFLTVTSGQKGTCVYLDGVLVKAAPHFQLSTKAFAGRLIVGDSAWQTDSWQGQILGLAIYHRQLTPKDVLQNYTAWKERGRPAIAQDERNVALYLFDENTGSVSHDKSGAGIDLYIPPRYQVIDKIALEPLWAEFSMTRNYWSAALKNIVGFIPFGFCFYAYLTTLSIKRATLVTVILGTAVSLTIEILQAYLPTRDSGTTDIITNTLGTWIGVASYSLLTPILVRFFPWLPFPAPPHR